MRERLGESITVTNGNGITPACAGKTLAFCCWQAASQDHPRMCGKDGIEMDFAGQVIGSPPHVRERQTYGKIRGL